MALIDVPSLARRLTDPDPPTVIDIRWRLGGPSAHADYRQGHIPGASFVDLDSELTGAPGPAGRHPLPDPHQLQRALRRAGVRGGHPVVAYDDGECQAAARLWWTLRWAGHDKVRILDGGFAAWVAAGRPVEPGEAVPRPGTIVVTTGAMPTLDADGAAGLARMGALLDARIAPRYLGETEPVDPVAGHIPGAVNLPAQRLRGPDGRLLPTADLRRLFEDAGVKAGAVGAYCGSGVTAAMLVLALAEAGFEGAPLYVGSWSNWVADPRRPVATGEGT